MKKKKNVGKRLCIVAIVLAVIIVMMFLLLFNQWLASRNRGSKLGVLDGIKTVQASELYYDNYWSKSIVTDIVDEDVPIPEGVEYVQGNKETGVIVKDSSTGNLMMWIPYDETVTIEGLEEYYQNCDYLPMDVDTAESIAKYGGFYVTLEKTDQYDALKSVGNESYRQAYEQAKKEKEESKSINSHLLYKEELAQILAYRQKIGTDVITTGDSKAQANTMIKLASTTNATVVSIAEGSYTLGVVTKTLANYSAEDAVTETTKLVCGDRIVVVPDGFIPAVKGEGVNAENNNGLVAKIYDSTNVSLRYVWVPVTESELTNALKQLKSAYADLDVSFWHGDAKDPSSDEYQALLESVKAFGGFYIGEAELTYAEDGTTVVNRAKGMEKKDKNSAGEYWGEYLRGSKVGSYQNAMEIASSIHSNNSEVTSHLMYGAEWDATMLWLLNTKTVTKEQIIQNSQEVPGAKYQYSITYDEKGNLRDEYLQALNGIYGLAGNLVDTTQETATIDGKTMHVGRGGNYNYTGEHYSMASRMVFSDSDIISRGEEIGFRNCLYLNKDAIESNQYLSVTKEGEVSVKEEYKAGGEKAKQLKGELTISSYINGIKVTSVAEKGFANCQNITKITLPDTINNIKPSALEGCQKLEEVIIATEEKLSIEEGAFRNCTKLTTLTFKAVPEEITIKDKAFHKCNKLTILNVPASMPEEKVEYIKEKIGTITSVNKIETYEQYFDITAEGTITLKKEYRGSDSGLETKPRRKTFYVT